ncbi:MAG: alpha/beta fold hydrolase [Chloroflexota bacterium]
MDQKGIVDVVTSRDGTPIAYWRSGSGPPLLLVHGGVSDHTRWAPVLPTLEQHCTVYAMDRRGRGQSGDAPDYALEREFEDVVAVVESIGGQVNLLGHSLGGFFALEAALRTTRLRRLVLDEPDVQGNPEAWDVPLLRTRDLLAAGDRESALVQFMREIAGLPPADIEIVRSQPSWPARVAAVHTVIREGLALNHYRSDVSRFRELSLPTLLVLGGETTPENRAGVDLLAATLPQSRLAVIPGQGHVSMLGAPDVWTHAVVGFLAEGDETVAT